VLIPTYFLTAVNISVIYDGMRCLVWSSTNNSEFKTLDDVHSLYTSSFHESPGCNVHTFWMHFCQQTTCEFTCELINWVLSSSINKSNQIDDGNGRCARQGPEIRLGTGTGSSTTTSQ